VKLAIIIASACIVFAVYIVAWSLCQLAAEADRCMNALTDEETEVPHVHA
jgi:hypothetical protein